MGLPEPHASTELPSPAAPEVSPYIWRIVAVVLLGPFLTQMDSTVVNVSLSSIRSALEASIAAAQWIISGYLLALAITLPLSGWLTDRLGTKRLYLVCFTAFTLASILCGFSQTMPQLIAARVLQGLAGGLLAPMTQLMLARAAGRQMGRFLGYASMPTLVAPIFGPVLAGAVLNYAGWPWLFYINLPVGVLAIALAAFVLPPDETPNETSSGRRPFDLVGLLTLSPGLVCLLYGLEEASHGRGFYFLPAGLVLVALFLRHAYRRRRAALIDLSLFRIHDFSVAAQTQFLANGIIFAGQFLIPLYLTAGCGLTAGEAAWMIAPMGLGMLVVYPLVGYLTDRFGFRRVATSGVLLNFLGTLPFLWMVRNEYIPWLVAASMVARGAGQGATGIPSTSAAYAAVPRKQLATANTALTIVQRLGGPFATTLIAIATSLASAGATGAHPHTYTVPFAALVVLQLLVLGSARRLPARALPVD